MSCLEDSTRPAKSPSGITTQRVSPQLASSSSSCSPPHLSLLPTASGAGTTPASATEPLISESRAIYKVKRFLFTLVQFGSDISADTGDKVKELVFNLVVSQCR